MIKYVAQLVCTVSSGDPVLRELEPLSMTRLVRTDSALPSLIRDLAELTDGEDNGFEIVITAVRTADYD